MRALLLALTAGIAAAAAAVGAADADNLDAMVAAAHARYVSGRAALVTRVVDEGGVMGRDEWEALVGDGLSDALRGELRSRQDAEAAAAGAAARTKSCVKVDVWRKDEDKVREFCAAFPREAILHIHPGGTRDLKTVRELLVQFDPLVNGSALVEVANDGKLTMLYEREVDALLGLPVQRYSEFGKEGRRVVEELFFLPEDPPSHDFKRFESLFEIGDALLEQDAENDDFLEEKTFLDFARRSKALGLSYAEFTKTGIPPSTEKLDRFDELKKLVFEETGVITNFVYAFVRTIFPVELNAGWTQDLLELVPSRPDDDATVGIDLLANEVNTSALETAQAIYVPLLAARESGDVALLSTMHSGELGDVRNVRDAMIMGCSRIGHGVLLQEDPVALEWARKESIGTVCSLVSNKLLQVQEDYSKHPFLKYLRLGMPVSLSTDDEGMFRTDIANECRIAVTNTDIQYSELAALSRNAITESFASDDVKKTLLEGLEAEFVAFEAVWAEEGVECEAQSDVDADETAEAVETECTRAGERAIGAEGYPRVPYFGCCDESTPEKIDGNWGLFCPTASEQAYK